MHINVQEEISRPEMQNKLKNIRGVETKDLGRFRAKQQDDLPCCSKGTEDGIILDSEKGSGEISHISVENWWDFVDGWSRDFRNAGPNSSRNGHRHHLDVRMARVA
ncbi:hypothetical protein [Pontibacter sp. G13]|uniref:hypothetical protein n=1 Tax=Pontibacter sp. G13 TaxID=3074898 RepID=UPI00288B18F2|nr:hypothetical protein [Pontibacter sp. G13]WNJ16417.1 hypothetical protein RJD25_16250 [Pontibacter sp. G13]